MNAARNNLQFWGAYGLLGIMYQILHYENMNIFYLLNWLHVVLWPLFFVLNFLLWWFVFFAVVLAVASFVSPKVGKFVAYCFNGLFKHLGYV